MLLIVGAGMILGGAYRIFKYNSEQRMDLQKVFQYKSNIDKPVINITEQTKGISSESSKPDEPAITRSEFTDGMMAVLIPEVGIKAAVMDGTDLNTLKKGPGLYKESDLPCMEKGNVCIAGHRDTYFKNLYKLQKDDEIDIIFMGYKYIYKVKDIETIEKYDWSPIKTTEKPSITLTTCHPETGNKQRIVVKGELYTVEKETDKL